MSKDTSKLDQRRALGERKAAEREARLAARPARFESEGEWVDEAAPIPGEVFIPKRSPAAPVKKLPAKKHPDPAVAAVARQIEEKKAQRDAKQSPRAGKRQIAVWLDEQLVKDLKHRSVELDETIEAIVTRGIELALDRWPR